MAETKVPAPGGTAPDFTLPDKDGKKVTLKELRGRWVVLYFYPEDDTPGCTLEAVDFSAENETLAEMGATVLGVSPDSEESHCRFYDKHDLHVTLLSDEKHAVIRRYGAWQPITLPGKETTGVVRSTFLIDPGGTVRHSWTGVHAAGHVAQVKDTLASLLEPAVSAPQ
ncbi:MAG: peroxiredoxin [Spirochaetes bacterium]|nr:MAG: peroxiredoxin [Spirochaetota bacterium]